MVAPEDSKMFNGWIKGSKDGKNDYARGGANHAIVTLHGSQRAVTLG